MIAPLRAADFLASLGVNVHLGQIGSARATEVTEAVTWLGLHNVRSALSDSQLLAGSVADQLARAGIHFNVLLGTVRPLEETIANAAKFAADHVGAVTSLEGPNEINLWPVNYNGLTGVEAATAFLNDAAAQAAAIPVLAGADIYDLTGAPLVDAVINDKATYANIHPYPQDGDQPFAFLAARIAQRVIPDKGMVITEAGYATEIGFSNWEGVDQLTQAKLTLNLIADATLLGVSKTFLYQLFDGSGTAAGTIDGSLGLFDANLQPKLAATALHNLTTVLGDEPGAPTDFATHALNYELTGLPASGHSLLLEKSNGTFSLMVWAEPDIWNEATDTAITAKVLPATVRFGDGPVDINVYDPLVSDQPVATYRQVTSVVLGISDHPLVVEVSGFAGPLPEVDPMWFDLPQELTGTTAVDILDGGTANDKLWGLAGNDILYGDAGDDTLWGGAGADTLHGGTGKDKLFGGAGADKLWGGAGADTFSFTGLADSRMAMSARDTIGDFDYAGRDRISLMAIDADPLRIGNQAFVFGGDQFTGVRGELIQVVTDAGVLVQVDVHGDYTADFAILLDQVYTPLAKAAFIL